MLHNETLAETSQVGDDCADCAIASLGHGVRGAAAHLQGAPAGSSLARAAGWCGALAAWRAGMCTPSSMRVQAACCAHGLTLPRIHLPLCLQVKKSDWKAYKPLEEVGPWET